MLTIHVSVRLRIVLLVVFILVNQVTYQRPKHVVVVFINVNPDMDKQLNLVAAIDIPVMVRTENINVITTPVNVQMLIKHGEIVDIINVYVTENV